MSDPLTPVAAIGLLANLRWREDTEIVNHEGRRVWLRPALDANSEQIGITDCCPVEFPCPRHAGLRRMAES